MPWPEIERRGEERGAASIAPTTPSFTCHRAPAAALARRRAAQTMTTAPSSACIT